MNPIFVNAVIGYSCARHNAELTAKLLAEELRKPESERRREYVYIAPPAPTAKHTLTRTESVIAVCAVAALILFVIYLVCAF